MVSSKLGAQIQKSGHAADRGTSGQRVAGGATRAALVQRQKRRFGRVSAVVLAPFCQYFGPGFAPGSRSPGAYKDPLGILQSKRQS